MNPSDDILLLVQGEHLRRRQVLQHPLLWRTFGSRSHMTVTWQPIRAAWQRGVAKLLDNGNTQQWHPVGGNISTSFLHISRVQTKSKWYTLASKCLNGPFMQITSNYERKVHKTQNKMHSYWLPSYSQWSTSPASIPAKALPYYGQISAGPKYFVILQSQRII